MLATLALMLSPATLPDDGWIAFEQPLVPGAAHVGCNAGDKVSLDSHDGTWLVNDGLRLAETFMVYVELKDGEPENVRSFTPDCVVTDADHAKQITIAPHDAVELIDDWLAMPLDRDVASQLVASVAHIDHASVNGVLERQAESVERESRAQDALFWLANRRGDAGREIVVEHLDDRWPVEHRRNAVMSLALSKHADAFEHVRRIARDAGEPELRAQAVMALGITDAPAAHADLHSILITDRAENVRRQAIFALAQLDSREAAETLLEIARDARNGELRREALFWLASMRHGERAVGTLVNDVL